MANTMTIEEVGIQDLCKAGRGLISTEEANHILQAIKEAISKSKSESKLGKLLATEVWKEVVNMRVLKPTHPHSLHQLVYYSVYAHWDASINGPPLYWFPSL